jgi:hypothetical protein
MREAESSNGKTFTPIEIKPKCSIKIYRTPNAAREYFTVSYYDEEGKRQRRLFQDLAEAERAANKLAGTLAKNEPPGLLVSGRDRLSVPTMHVRTPSVSEHWLTWPSRGLELVP